MIRNVKMERKGDTLTITVDLKSKGERSASGKSDVVATTGGNVDVPGAGEFKIGLNLYTKAG